MERARDWLRPKEVARLKKVSVQAVTAACREGRLPAQQAGSNWFIHRDDAEAWEPRKPLEPPEDL